MFPSMSTLGNFTHTAVLNQQDISNLLLTQSSRFATGNNIHQVTPVSVNNDQFHSNIPVIQHHQPATQIIITTSDHPHYNNNNITNNSPSLVQHQSSTLVPSSTPVVTQNRPGGPFVCNICNRSYTYQHGLSQHMRSHEGHKPYVCNQCNKAFGRKFQLDRHMKVHLNTMNNSSMISPQPSPIQSTQPTISYQCSECPEVFTLRDAFLVHLQTHGINNPQLLPVSSTWPLPKSNATLPGSLICFMCGKRFIDRYGLKRHFRSHSGDRPHECEVCGITFAELSHIKQHRLTHTGETPFTCVVCQRGFNRKFSYHRHLKWHAKSTLPPAALPPHLQEALGLAGLLKSPSHGGHSSNDSSTVSTSSATVIPVNYSTNPTS